MSNGAMTPDERVAFLADVHVGILAIDEPGRGPLALPVWYEFVDGAIEMRMDGSSLKARLLRSAGRATFTVQIEVAPYQYVSVEGPVTVVSDSGSNLAMATRYLGAELGQWYAENNPPTADSVVARITPEHWRTFDYGKALA
jgi:nitroimidazol reductase NimA-like FMN-containing flavoprotein (pyridoxamine 5'-phosphate oxidase superfamily)